MSPPLDSTNDAYHRQEASSPLIIDALHQFAYCPRRLHLVYVDGLMAHNAFTEYGKWVVFRKIPS